MNYRYVLLLMLGLTGLALRATAQEPLPRLILKLAPLSLIDPDGTLQAGAEVRTGLRRSVQAELGYGWRGLSLSESELDNFRHATIWRFRSELRFYTGRYRTNLRRGIQIRRDFPLGNYWAPELLLKRIDGQENVAVRNGTPAVPATGSLDGSYETGTRTIRRSVVGAHLKLGRQIALTRTVGTDGPLTLLDLYIGVGLRWAPTTVTYSGEPFPHCGCGFYDRLQNGASVLPSVAAGLKLGFAL